jgi:guanine nucleotide-binding protein subunit alpha
LLYFHYFTASRFLSYLDEIPRITAKKYIPTDGGYFINSLHGILKSYFTADVLKARLKTMGVVEHTFSISSGSNRGVQWKIYDVGGARNQRQAWAPYFEDSESPRCFT